MAATVLPVVSGLQIVTVSATSGTYTLTFDGQTTTALSATDATAATDVQNALNNQLTTSGIGGSVTVTGSSSTPGTLLVTFGGTLANLNLPAITVTNSGSLSGGTVTPTIGLAGGPTVSSLGNNVQQITITGATGGTFTLSFDGQTTTTVDQFNDPPSTVQTNLQALASIGAGNVLVTGAAATATSPAEYTIIFQGAWPTWRCRKSA